MSVSHVMLSCFAMLTCCHVLPELFTRMLPPSHGGTVTMTLEAPVSWLLRGRVIFSRRPFQLLLLSCWPFIMWGVWVHPSIYMSWLHGDWLVCALHPHHMELIPPPRYIFRGHPSSARWGSPSTYCAHSMFTGCDTYELVAFSSYTMLFHVSPHSRSSSWLLWFYMIWYTSVIYVSHVLQIPHDLYHRC